jgi:hypothetical protein
METTFTITSENGNMAIIRKDSHADGSVVESKAVAMRDGSYVCFSRNDRRPNWKKFSWGAMAAKRFGWQKEAADAYFAN